MTPAAPTVIDGLELVLFWLAAATTVVGALGLLFARKAVHAAMAMAMVMVTLGVVYIVQGAEFVGIIQVFVYSGAVMMLFLFVVMLVGVDASDSMVETLRGQRFWAYLLGGLFAVAAVFGLTRVEWPTPTGLASAQTEGTVTSLAREIFERQVLSFEVLGALLVIAVMGAMVLAHRERLVPRRTQREMADERVRSNRWVAGKPNPGVYARHNAADTPALAPDGTPVEESVPRVLVARGQVASPEQFRLPGSPGATDVSAKKGSSVRTADFTSFDPDTPQVDRTDDQEGER
ncbi:NADH-quinone oxidoreductase subunit J [Ornithinimicrobium tianjinense]|uniref:NADH-quinone oxidoreductase subunit J n=1 Tax=Ornithinimicrobium tianjinense TaxID=1195761 RepID=A0A917BR42_9MICO|nr:NADH-quinone oxidoreductase subunit J [Ornithinimicrobium tianjinense]GGF55642.1 NADH-quinone oxidoreductase subunit J [Ornithinimicrobium tianjinense]